MTDAFYFFATILLFVLFLLAVSTESFNSDFGKLEQYDGYVVVDKDKNISFLMENFVLIQKQIPVEADSNRVMFTCDDIMFQTLQVGDTLDYDRYEENFLK